MILYIIRHAWAEDRDDAKWPDDGQRPLSAEGRKRMARMAGELVRGPFAPTLIATSPLVRCVETAQIVAKELPDRPDVIELAQLAPGNDLEFLVGWTNEEAKRHDQIAWVGHAPDVDELAAALIGDGRAQIRFAKGAVAAIDFDGSVRPGGGELRWLVTAKVLRA
jgi:phosphohistidine phosphatase